MVDILLADCPKFEKLAEETMEKLQKAISNPDIDSEAVKKLTGIRESINSTITSLKNDLAQLQVNLIAKPRQTKSGSRSLS